MDLRSLKALKLQSLNKPSYLTSSNFLNPPPLIWINNTWSDIHIYTGFFSDTVDSKKAHEYHKDGWVAWHGGGLEAHKVQILTWPDLQLAGEGPDRKKHRQLWLMKCDSDGVLRKCPHYSPLCQRTDVTCFVQPRSDQSCPMVSSQWRW